MGGYEGIVGVGVMDEGLLIQTEKSEAASVEFQIPKVSLTLVNKLANNVFLKGSITNSRSNPVCPTA